MNTQTSTGASRRHEQRWGARVPLRVLAELLTADGDFEAVWVRDASLSGVFVETRRSLRLMTRVALCPTGRSGQWLDGFVVRGGEDGYGIEWLDPALYTVSVLLSLRQEVPVMAARPAAQNVSWRLMEHLSR